MEFPNETMNCGTCKHCYPCKRFNPLMKDSWEHGNCCVMPIRYPREKNETEEDRRYRVVMILNHAPENGMCEAWEERDE